MTDLSPRPPAITLAALSGLYLAQGLPAGLLAHALPALMSLDGIDVRWIGAIKLLALPWFFKFLWAPLVDRYGDRRYWILVLQSAAALSLLAVSLLPLAFSGSAFVILALLLLCLNLVSATQDVATDGLAVSVLPVRWHGAANSVQVVAYKIGLIAGGSGLLLVLDTLTWSIATQGMALLLLLLLLPVWLMPSRAGVVARETRTVSYWQDGFRGFFHHRVGMPSWLLVLLTFKVADSLGSAMIKPLLAAQGWDAAGMGGITAWASIHGLLGATLGGVLYFRWGAFRCLLGFGFLQAIGIGAWALLAIEPDRPVVYAIAAFEQLADGMSTVALFAVMMAWCRRGHEGGDYTLQMSLHMLIAGVGSVLSGFVAHTLGLTLHFLLAGLAGLASLWLVWRLRAVPMHGHRPASASATV